jgi:hydroxypyruvate reductase
VIPETSLRPDLAPIWNAALRAVDPAAAVTRVVTRRGSVIDIAGHSFDMGEAGTIWVLGAGKAVAPMAQSLEPILGKYLSGGLVVTKYGHGLPLDKVEILEAGHPLPDRNGVLAGERLCELLHTKIGAGDLALCLFSGGGSSLLVAPAPGITWEEKQQCTQLLLHSGATIHEMNALRKHISNVKGGGLAGMLASTRTVSLILSDVVGDDLDTIASGPLVPDPTTFAECLEILERLKIAPRIPLSIRERLAGGAEGRIPETPKRGNPIFSNKVNLIIGSNAQACSAAATEAQRRGYETMVLSSRIEGDTGEAARFHMGVVQEIIFEGRPLARPACIISGGETTVKVKGKGLGGRNMEFSLCCTLPLSRLPAPCVVASLGTDGTDGPTDAAGAVADNTTLIRSRKMGDQFFETCLHNNDSYRFFQSLDDLIITGPTRTNVMDLRIILIDV